MKTKNIRARVVKHASDDFDLRILSLDQDHLDPRNFRNHPDFESYEKKYNGFAQYICEGELLATRRAVAAGELVVKRPIAMERLRSAVKLIGGKRCTVEEGLFLTHNRLLPRLKEREDFVQVCFMAKVNDTRIPHPDEVEQYLGYGAEFQKPTGLFTLVKKNTLIEKDFVAFCMFMEYPKHLFSRH